MVKLTLYMHGVADKKQIAVPRFRTLLENWTSPKNNNLIWFIQVV